MQNANTGIIVLVALASLSLVALLIIRNRKDKKDFLPPWSADDPVEEDRGDERRRKDKI